MVVAVVLGFSVVITVGHDTEKRNKKKRDKMKNNG
jgi:hypothetical protein